MNLRRHSENRPGQNPQIFSSRSTPDFFNACDRLGKIQSWRAGGKNLNGSNPRTVFRMPSAAKTKTICSTSPKLILTKTSKSLSVFSKQTHFGSFHYQSSNPDI
jgi:hypothetical protein